MCASACVFYMCVTWGGPAPGVPPDCSLGYSASSACLKGMEMLFFLLNEKDFSGISHAFIHDMHIGAYAQACSLSHSRSWVGRLVYRRRNAVALHCVFHVFDIENFILCRIFLYQLDMICPWFLIVSAYVSWLAGGKKLN